jgi:hypothetical protein
MAGNYVQQGLDFLTGVSADEREDMENADEIRGNRKARGKAAFDRAGGDPFGRHAGLGFAMDTHRQGLANHSAAAGAINSAISGEMQSRVAQEREKRRMEHEKYLARMRVQMAKKEQEGNIIRSLLNG